MILWIMQVLKLFLNSIFDYFTGYNVIGVSLCSDNVTKSKVDQDAEYVEYVCKKLKIPWCNFHPSTEHWDQFSR